MQYAMIGLLILGQYWYIPTAIAAVSILMRMLYGES